MVIQPRHGDYVQKVAIRAIIQTTKQILVGSLHVRPRLRIKDALNHEDEEFIALTDVSLAGRKERIGILLLRRSEIVWIVPLEDKEDASTYLPVEGK